MADGHDDTMRDQLPLLQAGRLPAQDAAAVKAHVASCAACAAELALLERSARLFTAATPAVDVAAIVAKLPAPPAAAHPALRLERAGSRRAPMPRYVMAAAASLVLVATLSFAALRDRVFGTAPTVDGAPDTATQVVAPAAGGATAAVVNAPELAALGESELETLLAELEQLEATVAAEPVSLQRPVVTTPEGL